MIAQLSGPIAHRRSDLIPTELKDQIKKLSLNAKATADNILYKHQPERVNRSYDSSSHQIIFINYYPRPFWRYCLTPFDRPSVRGYRHRNKEDDKAIVAVALAAVVGGIALYTIGLVGQRLYNANRLLTQAKEVSREIKNTPATDLSDEDRNYLSSAQNVAHHQMDISERVKSSSIKDLIIRISVFAASVFVILGAVAILPEIAMAVGAAVGVSALALALIKAVLSKDTQANIASAQQIELLNRNPQLIIG